MKVVFSSFFIVEPSSVENSSKAESSLKNSLHYLYYFIYYYFLLHVQSIFQVHVHI